MKQNRLLFLYPVNFEVSCTSDSLICFRGSLDSLLYNLLYYLSVFNPPNIHSVSNPCNISVGHVFGQVFYWLAPKYILTYFPEIQKIFS